MERLFLCSVSTYHINLIFYCLIKQNEIVLQKKLDQPTLLSQALLDIYMQQKRMSYIKKQKQYSEDTLEKYRLTLKNKMVIIIIIFYK